jgi:hypothetical protein
MTHPSTAAEFSEQVKGTASALKMGMLLAGIPPEYVERSEVLEWLKAVAMNLESRNCQINSLQRLFFDDDGGEK